MNTSTHQLHDKTKGNILKKKKGTDDEGFLPSQTVAIASPHIHFLLTPCCLQAGFSWWIPS
jgi:hypothetical protein